MTCFPNIDLLRKGNVPQLESVVFDTTKPFLIYGAHKVGNYLLNSAKGKGVSISGFVDKNKQKQKDGFCGLPVLPPTSSCLRDANIIVASGRYSQEIISELVNKDYSCWNMHSFQYSFALPHQAEPNFRAFNSNLLENATSYLNSFELLRDELSALK